VAPDPIGQTAAGDQPQLSKEPRRVLVVTPDTLGDRMAGPAIRAWEISKALSAYAQVRLVSTVAAARPGVGFEVSYVDDQQLRAHADWADVIVFQGHVLRTHSWMKSHENILVADIYDPLHLEQMEQGKDLSAADRDAVAADTVEVLNDQIERADFMTCASEKQRDFWIGHLASLARINPATYDADPTLRNLLDVASFGVSDATPVQKRHAIKGAVDGISATDKVIIWGGGIYNWFDPLTLIQAVAILSEKHDDIRLFFLGVSHPNPNVPAMRMSVEALELSNRLGLTNKVVFFNSSWVPYEERADYLLDADIGVSTHYNHVETAFSFRTRILDYLWASLPIVSTDGDTFADWIRQHELGTVVPPEDVDSLVHAIESVVYDDSKHSVHSKNVAVFSQTMTWSKTLSSLIRFCLAPHPAADRSTEFMSERARIKESLEVRIDGLESSTSWRLTAPLRAVSGLFNSSRDKSSE